MIKALYGPRGAGKSTCIRKFCKKFSCEFDIAVITLNSAHGRQLDVGPPVDVTYNVQALKGRRYDVILIDDIDCYGAFDKKRELVEYARAIADNVIYTSSQPEYTLAQSLGISIHSLPPPKRFLRNDKSSIRRSRLLTN